jgi:hypothetical protein
MPKEHLSLKQRAVQRALRQDARRGHATTIPTAGPFIPAWQRGRALDDGAELLFSGSPDVRYS